MFFRTGVLLHTGGSYFSLPFFLLSLFQETCKLAHIIFWIPLILLCTHTNWRLFFPGPVLFTSLNINCRLPGQTANIITLVMSEKSCVNICRVCYCCEIGNWLRLPWCAWLWQLALRYRKMSPHTEKYTHTHKHTLFKGEKEVCRTLLLFRLWWVSKEETF